MRNVRAALVFILIVTLFAAACGGAQATAPSSPTSAAVNGSPATIYLNEVVGLMEANSINRSTINWTDFRAQVFARAQGAQSIADTYPAISLALGLLNDHHSFYTAASGSGLGNPSSRRCAAPAVSNPAVPADIGYVRVGSFGGTDIAAVRAFADSVQDQIRESDRPGLAGWIVDLRGNGGGHMWPIPPAVGPAVGERACRHLNPPSRAAAQRAHSDGPP